MRVCAPRSPRRNWIRITQNRADLQGLPNAQPHGCRRGWRGRRASRTTASTTISTTPCPVAIGCATRTRSNTSSTSPKEMLQMEHWGCPWSREPDGQIAVRPFGGMKIERTWFAADKTGFHMLHTLFQTSLQFPLDHALRRVLRDRVAGRGRRCSGVWRSKCASGKMRAIPRQAR